MTTTRLSVAIATTMLLVASCGGGSDGSADDASADTANAAESTESSESTDAPADTSGATEDDDTGTAGDFEPGDIEFRVVNTLDEPVDIYVRTTGLVEAYPIADGVEPGEVTEFVAPPADGVFLVTEAGAGDPTCVSGCDHFIAELSAFAENGPAHTVVLYTDDGGSPAAFDLWEQPEAGSEGNANAMVAVDTDSGVVVATAISLSDADFGLRLAVDGTTGCLEPFNLDNILVGGNQTPAFSYDGDSVDLVLHDNTDRECAEEPVGGPFTVDGGPGTRSHLILTGTPGDMDAIVVTMGNGAIAISSDDDDESSSDVGDRSTAIEQMTVEVEANLGLSPEQSECVATLLVDAIGTDVLLVDGNLVDLDGLPAEYDAPAEQAIVQSIDVCGVDPDSLGG